MAHGVYAAATPSPTPGSPLPHPNHSRCHCAGAICAATSCGDGDDSCCCFVRHTLPLLRTKEDGAHRASPSVVFRSMTSAAGGRERQWRRVWTTPLRTPPRQHAQHERPPCLLKGRAAGGGVGYFVVGRRRLGRLFAASLSPVCVLLQCPVFPQFPIPFGPDFPRRDRMRPGPGRIPATPEGGVLVPSSRPGAFCGKHQRAGGLINNNKYSKLHVHRPAGPLLATPAPAATPLLGDRPEKPGRPFGF